MINTLIIHSIESKRLIYNRRYAYTIIDRDLQQRDWRNGRNCRLGCEKRHKVSPHSQISTVKNEMFEIHYLIYFYDETMFFIQNIIKI